MCMVLTCKNSSARNLHILQECARWCKIFYVGFNTSFIKDLFPCILYHCGLKCYMYYLGNYMYVCNKWSCLLLITSMCNVTCLLQNLGYMSQRPVVRNGAIVMNYTGGSKCPHGSSTINTTVTLMCETKVLYVYSPLPDMVYILVHIDFWIDVHVQ